MQMSICHNVCGTALIVLGLLSTAPCFATENEDKLGKHEQPQNSRLTEFTDANFGVHFSHSAAITTEYNPHGGANVVLMQWKGNPFGGLKIGKLPPGDGAEFVKGGIEYYAQKYRTTNVEYRVYKSPLRYTFHCLTVQAQVLGKTCLVERFVYLRPVDYVRKASFNSDFGAFSFEFMYDKAEAAAVAPEIQTVIDTFKLEVAPGTQAVIDTRKPDGEAGGTRKGSRKSVASLLPTGVWAQVFHDEFDGADAILDEAWVFQNGPSGHILCSRWRENAKVRNGVLKLIAKKEQRGGQEWTAASMWTKRKFKYGYFECRYRYGRTTGLNNSFWIMTRDLPADADGKFEIDINEGHYTNEINMNIHKWSGTHTASSRQKKIDGADLGEEYHVYGLEWSEKELVWYFDGKEIRREENTLCHREAPVLLSLAVIKWAGPVTDAINGASMDVDYVRVYERKLP